MLHSCFYEGRVSHTRYLPKRHHFEYPLFMWAFDLDELQSGALSKQGLGIEKRAFYTFRREDYFRPVEQDLKKALIDRLQKETGYRHHGRIMMLTQVRFLGFVFNPVTFYYFIDENVPKYVIADINNTPWNERYQYCIKLEGLEHNKMSSAVVFKKAFHISPFMEMAQSYEWSFSDAKQNVGVLMQSYEKEKKMFTASFQGARVDWEVFKLKSKTFQYMLQPQMIFCRIYWQALRLYLKKIPFCPHPHKKGISSVQVTK